MLKNSYNYGKKNEKMNIKNNSNINSYLYFL